MSEYIAPPSTLPAGSIVDAYLRDSGGSNQDRSVERQFEALTDYCKTHHLILRSPYQDVARSGKTTAGREAFQAMIDDYEIPARRPIALLLWNFARFARDVDDSQLYKAILRKWGIIIHSLTDPIPEGRYSRVIEVLIETANQEKREQTSADAADGLRHIVAQGAMPGTPPRGFRREPLITLNSRTGEQRTNHRWVPDPDWILRIQQAFALKASGATTREIHRQTNIYPSKNSYSTFFTNKLYIGTLEFGNRTFENYCAPIIDLETWNAVQHTILLHKRLQASSNTLVHPRRNSESHHNYPLTGLVFCARCGSPLNGMTSRQRSGGYYYRYACSSRRLLSGQCSLKPIPARALEKEVTANLIHFFEHPQNIALILEQIRLEHDEVEKNQQTIIDDLKKQLSQNRRSLNHVTEAISISGPSKALIGKLHDLETISANLETTILREERKLNTPMPVYSPKDISTLGNKIIEEMRNTDTQTQKSIFRTLVNQVIVDRIGKSVFITLELKIPNIESDSPPDDPDGQSDIKTASMDRCPQTGSCYTYSLSFAFAVRSYTLQLA